MKVYSVYDGKAQAFNQPFFMRTDGEVLRSFSEVVNEKGHQFNKHAGDYTLFQIGEFDEQSGMISPLNTPRSLGLALEFVVQPSVN